MCNGTNLNGIVLISGSRILDLSHYLRYLLMHISLTLNLLTFQFIRLAGKIFAFINNHLVNSESPNMIQYLKYGCKLSFTFFFLSKSISSLHFPFLINQIGTASTSSIWWLLPELCVIWIRKRPARNMVCLQTHLLLSNPSFLFVISRILSFISKLFCMFMLILQAKRRDVFLFYYRNN